QTLAWDLLTGTASNQLYYILLTLEFYLLLPWFLRVAVWFGRRPRTTLAISFALEVATLYINQYVLPALPLSSGASALVALFFDRFVLTYQFYFVLGALAAQHLAGLRALTLRHVGALLGAGVASLALLELHYAYALTIAHEPLSSAVAVLQPVMAVYSLGVIAALYAWAWWRVARRSPAGTPGGRTSRLWHALSDASFGIYLVHPLVLGAILTGLVPHLAAWPAALVIALTWLLGIAGSTAFSLLALRTPFLSRLVGREGPATGDWSGRRVRLGGVPVAGWIGWAAPAESGSPLSVRDAHTARRRGVPRREPGERAAAAPLSLGEEVGG